MLNKILVLTESYPSPEKLYNMSFVHSRNIQYLKLGVEVDVISFSSKEMYTFEGVDVYTKNKKIDFSSYDAVLSHAPNIRNHYYFLSKNYNQIKKIVFFFHGHEILIIEDYYPKPYVWQQDSSWLDKKLRRIYDQFKLLLIRRFLRKEKISSIFVSEWMLNEGLKNLKIKSKDKIKACVINNSISCYFYNKNYRFNFSEKKADFITIRPFDGRKYALDKVVELAENNPKYTFHIYGKGNFFKYNAKPENVTVFDEFIEQKDIPYLLNYYTAAVMPTRLDAQGVMMCEMASYGIPTLVSDLSVCREMLEGYPNCTFIKNHKFNQTNLTELTLSRLTDFSVTDKFSPEMLAKRELAFILSSASSEQIN